MPHPLSLYTDGVTRFSDEGTAFEMIAKRLQHCLPCSYQSVWRLGDKLTQRRTVFATAQLRLAGLIGSGIMGLLVATNHPAASGQTATPAPVQTAPAAETTPTGSGGRSTLRPGSQGERVVELQALLTLLGYYSGAIDGVYQDSTARAVIAFQQAAGLQADGIVGANTWNRLLPSAAPNSPTAAAPAPAPAPAVASAPATAQPAADSPATSQPAAANSTAATPSASPAVDLPVLRLGMRGPAVARLQERLRTAGFFEGTIDGIFGAETQAAVRAAQRRFRLEPDGIVGAATWTALLQ